MVLGSKPRSLRFVWGSAVRQRFPSLGLGRYCGVSVGAEQSRPVNSTNNEMRNDVRKEGKKVFSGGEVG